MFIMLLGLPVVDDGRPGFLLMFWNVENLFESRPHFRDKCTGIAKTVMLAGDEYGSIPDVIGLAEVENKAVLQKLLSRTGLRKYDYGIIHYDSHDRRGIDCALLYRRSRFKILHTKPCHLYDTFGRLLPTRDILLAILEPVALPEGIPPEGRNTRGSIAGGPSRRDGGVSPKGELPKGVYLPASTIAVLINHHPSKVGKESEERRRIAMDRLLFLRDSLLAEGISRIVAVGDFNDEVIPAAGVVAAYPRGSGTIKFQGKWEKIDGCPVLEGMTAREHIFAPPHLSTRDTRFSGVKPLRSYSGPRYLGGISDHYPVVFEVLPRACCPEKRDSSNAEDIEKITIFERCNYAETKN